MDSDFHSHFFTGLNIYHHIYYIAHMPHIDIPKSQQYAGCLSHEPSLMTLAPTSQWLSIRTSNRKVLGSIPIGRTRIFFFRVSLCHSLKNINLIYEPCYDLFILIPSLGF